MIGRKIHWPCIRFSLFFCKENINSVDYSSQEVSFLYIIDFIHIAFIFNMGRKPWGENNGKLNQMSGRKKLMCWDIFRKSYHNLK
jgi:hypothetical protein